MWQALTKGYLPYRGRSVDRLAEIGATIEATIAKGNKAVSTEVSRGHSSWRNELSKSKRKEVSQTSEGLNVKRFQFNKELYTAHQV